MSVFWLWLLLVLMSVHKPFVNLELFSLKPYLVGMGTLSLALVLTRHPRNWPSGQIHEAVLPVLALMVAILLSAFQAVDVGRAFVLLAALGVVIMLSGLLYRLSAEASTAQTLRCTLLAGILLAALSIAGYVLNVRGFLMDMEFIYRGNPNLSAASDAPRMMGLHLDPNFFALTMSFYFLVALAALVSLGTSDRRLRWLAALSWVGTGVCLLGSLSRGGMLGVMAAVVLLLIANGPRLLRAIFRRAAVWVIALAVLSGLMIWVLPDNARSYFLERLTDLSVAKEYESGGRPLLWRAAWRVFADHPILGVGLGNVILMPRYFEDVMFIQYTHNTFLEIMAETGVVGLCSYLWWLGSVFRALWLAQRRALPGVQRVLVGGLISANVASLVQMMFLSALYEPLLWGLWGVSFGVAARIRKGLD
jgi:O-antigen ligase